MVFSAHDDASEAIDESSPIAWHATARHYRTPSAWLYWRLREKDLIV